MALLIPFLLSFSLFSSTVFADYGYTPSQYCFYACNAVYYLVTYTGSQAYCSDSLTFNSTYYCAAIYCSPHELSAGIKSWEAYCDSLGTPATAYDDVVSGVDLDSLRRISLQQIEGVNFSQPVIPDAALYANGYRTIAAFYDNFALSYDFTWSIYAFWGIVVFIGMVDRVAHIIYHRRTKQTELSQGDRNKPPSAFTTQTWLWIRRCLILPASFHHHCQEPIGWYTIPARLENILITIYVTLNIVYCFPGYDIFQPNLYYMTQTRFQLTRYVADRTGVLAFANLPLIWIFATRNDPLLWLTGWSFGTYNNFHRWVARVATVQAVVHSICYTAYDLYQSPAALAADWASQYWYTGEMATILMCLMLPLSLYGLRKNYYDLFLMLHISCGVIILACLYFHVNKIFTGDFNGFIWPCVAIWVLDRLIRIGRFTYISLMPYWLKGTSAVASYNEQADIIRLDITDFLRTSKIRPGMFYYLYFPNSRPGWESHPFSFCSWRDDGELASPVLSLDEPEKISDEKTGHTIRSTASDLERQSFIRHTVLIRPYDGMTGRMKQKITSAAGAEGANTNLMIMLEGPYGNNIDLSRYSDVLIIAGGSGVTAAITHSSFLLEQGHTRIRIIWAIAQKQLVDDVCAHEMNTILDSENVHMDVYLTEAAVLDGGDAVGRYGVHLGRPDLDKAMAAARDSCRADLAVVACGTPGMADACRKAVVTLLKSPGPHVGYYNETLTW